jgi:AcrR family transcriptional regulator
MAASSIDRTGKSTIDRVLANAAELFSEKGYAATTTRELAARTGLKSASLYHHIGTKEDLLHRLCMSTLQEIEAAFSNVLARQGDALETLHELVVTYVDLLLSERGQHVAMLNEIRALSPERREQVVALRDHNLGQVRAVIRRAQRAGQFRKDLNAKYVTLSLFNMLNWTIFWYDPQGDLDPPALAELFWKLFVQGMAAQ